MRARTHAWCSAPRCVRQAHFVCFGKLCCHECRRYLLVLDPRASRSARREGERALQTQHRRA